MFSAGLKRNVDVSLVSLLLTLSAFIKSTLIGLLGKLVLLYFGTEPLLSKHRVKNQRWDDSFCNLQKTRLLELKMGKNLCITAARMTLFIMLQLAKILICLITIWPGIPFLSELFDVVDVLHNSHYNIIDYIIGTRNLQKSGSVHGTMDQYNWILVGSFNLLQSEINKKTNQKCAL